MAFRNLALLVSAATALYGFRANTNEGQVHQVGEFENLDKFFEMLGTNSTSWKDVTVYDSAAELVDNSRQSPHDETSRSPSSLANLQKRDRCHQRNGWDEIICDDMPNHEWQWAFGDAYPISYDSDKLMKWLKKLAAEIKKGKDLTNKWHDGANLGKRRNLHPFSSNGTSLHFTLPNLRGPEIFNPGNNETNKGNSTIQVDIQSHYKYHVEAGELSYQGTTASFSSNKPMLEPHTNKTSTASDTVNKEFTIVLQVWRKSDAMPPKSLSEKCMAKVMRWHIERASHAHRYICTQIDRRGEWWAWYNVNINRKNHLTQTNGACCAN